MLAATALIFIALGLGFGLWAGSVPVMRATFALDAQQIGVVLLCVAGGSIATMSQMPRWTTRFGSTRCSFASGVAFALGFLPLTAAAGWLTLCGAAIVLGTTMGALDVAMNALASDLERYRTQPIMSRLHAGFSLGGMCGAVVASALIGRGFGLGGLYGAASVLVFVVIAGAALLARTGRSAQTIVVAAPTTVEEDATVQAAALPQGVMIALGAVTALAMICEGAVGDWGGLFAVKALSAQMRDGALCYAVFSAAMVIMRLAGDTLRQRYGTRQLIRGGAALASVGFVLIAISPSFGRTAVAMIGFAVTGFGLATLVPLAFSEAGRLGRARAVAQTAVWGYGGFLLGPPTVSAVISMCGLRPAFVILAGAAAAICVLAVTRLSA